MTAYKDRLKQVYQAPPPTWDPLPRCGHIKLAMIREKGKRRGIADEEIVKHQMEGAVHCKKHGVSLTPFCGVICLCENDTVFWCHTMTPHNGVTSDTIMWCYYNTILVTT